MMSLPSRERGLKFASINGLLVRINVAPFAGAWIEIKNCIQILIKSLVAPFAGAWIEMVKNEWQGLNGQSLPSRERGLKSAERVDELNPSQSLPSRERGLKYIGIIQIFPMLRRSLRGSVD